MTAVSRRMFLGGVTGSAVLGATVTGVANAATGPSERSGLAGTGSVVAGSPSAPLIVNVETTREHRRAVVIGTGFGGAITGTTSIIGFGIVAPEGPVRLRPDP